MRNRALESWLQRQLPRWRDASDLLDRVEQSKAASRPDVMTTVRNYGEIGRDLTLARQAAPAGNLTRYLANLYGRHHRALYRNPGSHRHGLRQLLLFDAPAVARSLAPQIASVALAFVASALAGWWLVGRYPELAAMLASEDMINGVSRGELWTDDLLNVVPSSYLALSILTNNIAVTVFAACLGVFYGLGTMYIIGLNGLMLGGIFAMTAQHGLAGRLFEFVIAHGIVELSVICIAGAVGVSLGAAIARPGDRTRAQAFHRASIAGARLLTLCALFLTGAGLIEGFVSPDPRYPVTAKIAIGIVYMMLFGAAIGGLPARLAGRTRKP